MAGRDWIFQTKERGDLLNEQEKKTQTLTNRWIYSNDWKLRENDVKFHVRIF